jgi:hypothetical protein
MTVGTVTELVRRACSKVEKEQYFRDRTNKHIGLVQNAAAKIVAAYPEFADLLTMCRHHDASKFCEPECSPYVELTWQHKQDGHKNYQTPGAISDEKINQATMHHVLNNTHHPEHWNQANAGIDPSNRNKGVKCISAAAMPPLAIAEMVADWQAMSEELRTNTAREWYNKQKGVRWNFSAEQDKLIDKLLKVFGV